MMRRSTGLAILLAVTPLAAMAQDAGTVRVSNQPGFGRIAFEFPAPTGFSSSLDGDRLTITFNGAPNVGSPGGLPKNVRSILGGQGSATILLGAGARARSYGVGSRVVVDVTGPPAPRPGRLQGGQPVLRRSPIAPSAADAPPAASQPAPASPVHQDAMPEVAPQVDAGRTGTPSGDVPAQPGADAAVPSGAPAGPAAPVPAAPAQATLPSMLIPSEAGVGAAAFRRGDLALVVFDSPVEVDEARMRRVQALSGALVQRGPTATVLHVPLPSGTISMVRETRGWRVSAAEASGPPIETVPADAGVLFKLPQPGRVVAIADPGTGGVLLVGTSNPTVGPASGMLHGSGLPGAAVLPTWAGVAAEPFSDEVVLRPVAASGFMLEMPGGSTKPSPSTPAPALTRRFDFPDLPIPALMQRLRAAQAGAAAAPPRGRSPARIATAQAMLALGMSAEAQAVLSLVAADDPAAASNADVAGLSAIAALLAGRLDATAGLEGPGLSGTDDVAMWRGVRDAVLGRDTAAVQALPPLMPLALAYPAPLRDRVLPIVAETAVLADHPIASALPDLPRLGFARALQMERHGQMDEALAALDALAAGQDQLDQVRAGARAVELRLASSRITPAEAAAAMGHLVATWRGDAKEAAMRLRVAELHEKAGAWRPALDMLRETEALFPNSRPALRARMAGVFGAFVAGGAAVAPLDVVTLAADYADCVPPGPAGAGLAGLLTDKLLDLDLTGRARALLETAVAAAPAGPVRSGLGHRLAGLQLDDGDADAAGRTLRATDAADLPDRLRGERALLHAKVQAARGDLAGAAAGLLPVGTAAADDLRARMLERTGDWRGAFSALDDLAARLIPATGPLADAGVELVLRQASAAAQAGDPALLRGLAERYAARLSGPQTDLFQLLTASPIGGVGDLPRAAKEMALARAAPGVLGKLAAR